MWIQGNQLKPPQLKDSNLRNQFVTFKFFVVTNINIFSFFFFSVPLSMEEMSRSLLDVNISDMDPPALLRQRSDFHFGIVYPQGCHWVTLELNWLGKEADHIFKSGKCPVSAR